MPAPGVKYPHRVMTSVSDEQMDDLTAEAVRTDLPIATIIRDAIRQRYERNDKKGSSK